MELTEIKQIDNDYAIIQAKFNCDGDHYENWGRPEVNMEVYHKKLEALAELGQKEAIMLWKAAQIRNKVQGKPYKENKKIDEQIEKMDKSCIQYKIISIDKLWEEDDISKCYEKLNKYKDLSDKLEDEIYNLKELKSDNKELNAKISKMITMHDKIKNQIKLEFIKILGTSYYDAIHDLAVYEFNELMNTISVLDCSFLYRNTIIFIREYNKVLRKFGNQELCIKNDNNKVIEKKLKALYKANPNVPYVALRYANFLRHESLMLKLTGSKIMKKISKMPLSKDAENTIVQKFLRIDEKEYVIEI